MAKKHGAKQQKKAARKKSHRNARQAERNRRTTKDPSVRFQGAANWPVHAAYRSKSLWEDGIGFIVLARKSSGSQLIVVRYLVDVYCLGVKDVAWDGETVDSLPGYLEEVEERVPLVQVSPAYAAKVVQGAVDFAASYGLAPCPEYKHAKKLLEGIDPSECNEEFVFGKDGEIFYMQGPYDSPEKVRMIMAKLAGTGRYFISTPGNPYPATELYFDDEDLDSLGADDDDLYDDDDDDVPPPEDDIVVG